MPPGSGPTAKRAANFVTDGEERRDGEVGFSKPGLPGSGSFSDRSLCGQPLSDDREKRTLLDTDIWRRCRRRNAMPRQPLLADQLYVEGQSRVLFDHDLHRGRWDLLAR